MKFSVITVCLNSDKTIERTVKSFIEQKHAEKELIVVDGESSDNTLGILHKYQTQISRIISEKDKGIYDAMNKGLMYATGHYVCFLNSDDYFSDESVLSDIDAFLISNEYTPDLVYGKACIVDSLTDNKKIIGKPVRIQNFYYGQAIVHQSAFYNRQIFKNIGNFSLTVPGGAADYEWFVRFFSRDKPSAGFIDRMIVIFSEGGATSRFLWRNYKARTQIAMRFFPLRIRLRYLFVFPFMRVKLCALDLFFGKTLHKYYRILKTRILKARA